MSKEIARIEDADRSTALIELDRRSKRIEIFIYEGEDLISNLMLSLNLDQTRQLIGALQCAAGQLEEAQKAQESSAEEVVSQPEPSLESRVASLETAVLGLISRIK